MESNKLPWAESDTFKNRKIAMKVNELLKRQKHDCEVRMIMHQIIHEHAIGKKRLDPSINEKLFSEIYKLNAKKISHKKGKVTEQDRKRLVEFSKLREERSVPFKETNEKCHPKQKYLLDKYVDKLSSEVDELLNKTRHKQRIIELLRTI